MDNLARRGPKQVWDGYKTMRVPTEIFDDVRKYMERRKQIFLAEQEGIQISEDELPHSSMYSLPNGSSSDMTELIRQTIREEMKNAGSLGDDRIKIPPPTLTSQERVKQLLIQKPGEMLGLPNSTAREATRTIAEDMPEIKKIPGRPNKFIYEP